MKMSLAIDTSEGRRRFDLLTSRLSDLTPVLREFDKYKRDRVQAIFDQQGPGWPGRAEPREDILNRREKEIRERAVSSLRNTLVYDIRRSFRRVERGKGRMTAVVRGQQRLQAFEDMVEAGAIDFDVLAGKTRKGLVDRRFYRRNPRAIRRYQEAREMARQLLGRIPQSITSKVERGLLTIESKIPWAGVHNEGGKAGNDAEIPARPFLFWDDVDLGFLLLLLREAGLVAMGAA